jgi:hypothetical protein
VRKKLTSVRLKPEQLKKLEKISVRDDAFTIPSERALVEAPGDLLRLLRCKMQKVYFQRPKFVGRPCIRGIDT